MTDRSPHDPVLARRAAALAAVLCAAPILGTGSAAAQGAPIYAPCLERHPSTDGYIAAMEAAGWSQRTWGMTRNRAAPPVAEIGLAMLGMPQRFRNAVETQAHVDRMADMYRDRIEFDEIFTRDGLSATVSRHVGEFPAEDGSFRVNCTFAGAEVPDAAAIFADDTRGMDSIAIEIGIADVALPEGSLDISVMAIRYTGPEAVLGPLSGREGILVTHDFEPPQ